MLQIIDVGREVMPSNPAGGWLLICAALIVGAALVVLARRAAAVLADRVLHERERDIDEAVAWAEDEPADSGQATDAVPVAGRSRQVDLARNNMMLLVRQLAFIDELKAHESDPDTLADLDRLEQLTLQMRRNCASVMVVAGFDPVRTHHRPMPASEVLRQALGGIEQSARVTLSVMADPAVPPHLSAELMHLLAEVIDNATRFSEPTSTVMVLVTHTEGGLRVRVADDGAGIGPDKLAELNDLILNPPSGTPEDVDAVAVRGLGLAAVGRIAQQIGAVVILNSSIGRGTVASIDLPLGPDGNADQQAVPDALDDARPAALPAPVLPAPVLPAPELLAPQAELLAPIDTAPFVEPEVFEPLHVGLADLEPLPILAAPAFLEPDPPPYRDHAEMAAPAPRPHPEPAPPPTMPSPMPSPYGDDAQAVPPAPSPIPSQAPAPAEPPTSFPVPAPRPDVPPDNLTGISWLSAVGEPPAHTGPAGNAYPAGDAFGEVPAITHAAAEAAVRPPAPWDLDDDQSPATALAVDVLPRRKTLLPGKNRPKREEPDA